MPKKSHGNLIKKIREFIASHEGSYSQENLYMDANQCGIINSFNTIANAEGNQGLRLDTFETLAKALTMRLREVRTRHPKSKLLDPLQVPQLGWLIDRLIRGINPTLEAKHLIINHSGRYLIEDYKISLTVCPYPDGKAEIPLQGQVVHTFDYDNVAAVKYSLRYSKENQRNEPGFKLAYGTHQGKIKLLTPSEDKLNEDRGYRLHKTSASYLPDPNEGPKHGMELLVFNGYGSGHETGHFSMSQPAVYQNVTFALDLSAYPEDAFVCLPELIMVPVLSDRPYDCCEIASDGRGLPIKADEQHGLSLKWKFHDLMNVMICIKWNLDRSKLKRGGMVLPEALIRTLATR